MKRLVYSYLQAHNNVQGVYIDDVLICMKINKHFTALVEGKDGRGFVAYTQVLGEGEKPAYKDAFVVADVDEVRCVAETTYDDQGRQFQKPVNKAEWGEWRVKLHSYGNVIAYEPSKI